MFQIPFIFSGAFLIDTIIGDRNTTSPFGHSSFKRRRGYSYFPPLLVEEGLRGGDFFFYVSPTGRTNFWYLKFLFFTRTHTNKHLYHLRNNISRFLYHHSIPYF